MKRNFLPLSLALFPSSLFCIIKCKMASDAFIALRFIAPQCLAVSLPVHVYMPSSAPPQPLPQPHSKPSRRISLPGEFPNQQNQLCLTWSSAEWVSPPCEIVKLYKQANHILHVNKGSLHSLHHKAWLLGPWLAFCTPKYNPCMVLPGLWHPPPLLCEYLRLVICLASGGVCSATYYSE